MLAAPGATKTFKEFEAELYVLTQEEGGRHTPFLNNYRPQFYVRTADVTGAFVCRCFVVGGPVGGRVFYLSVLSGGRAGDRPTVCVPVFVSVCVCVSLLALKSPAFSHRRVCCFFPTRSVRCAPPGSITLPEGKEMAMPGDNTTVKVDLIYPTVLNEGLRFAVREGGRTVAAGVVAKLLQ